MDLLGEVTRQREQAIAKVFELEEQLDTAKILLDIANSELEKLNNAYQALSGTSSPRVLPPGEQALGPSERPVQAVLPSPRIPIGAIECGSCSGAMFHQSRTLQSGRVVQLWVCGDCSNERL